jgi:hypothetical protein
MISNPRKPKPMTGSRTPPLDERIRQIRTEIESILEARAEAVARQSPGVPVAVIRNLLTAHAPACRCAQYMEILDKGAG